MRRVLCKLVALVHKDDYYCTPPQIVIEIESETGLKFELDAAANESNSLCPAFLSEESDALKQEWLVKAIDNNSTITPGVKVPVFCNPPRSKNGKFIRKAFEEWNKWNMDIVVLVCWNDFGNKYGQECIIQPKQLGQLIEIHNLGKVTFYKDGQISKFPSRLNYCWVWFKKRPELTQSQFVTVTQ